MTLDLLINPHMRLMQKDDNPGLVAGGDGDILIGGSPHTRDGAHMTREVDAHHAACLAKTTLGCRMVESAEQVGVDRKVPCHEMTIRETTKKMSFTTMGKATHGQFRARNIDQPTTKNDLAKRRSGVVSTRPRLFPLKTPFWPNPRWIVISNPKFQSGTANLHEKGCLIAPKLHSKGKACCPSRPR